MANPKILFIEDDSRLRQLTSDFLRKNGFDVIDQADGTQALSVVQQGDIDLIILDIMLPGEDGYSLCQSIRSVYKGPLLFLTAKADISDELLGFEVGGDDYITKPVEPKVLLARIRALLRRAPQQQQPPSQSLQFDHLVIDRQSRKVTLHSEAIEFTSHEFDLLVLLAENAGNVVDREFIYKQIIGREYDGLDRSADVRISRLRKKLGDNPQQPFRIKTIWGKGFFFVPSAWT